MKKILTTTITCLLVLLTVNLQAQTSNLSVQGVLRNSNGTAVENGTYDITFRLYDSVMDTLVWEEMMSDVDVEGGIYSVILGSEETPLDASFDIPYTLGIAIEGGTELIPRAKLTSSPYALSLIGNDNVFPNTGNVGVGASKPQNKLTVARGNTTLGLEVEKDVDNHSVLTTKADGLEFSTNGADNAYYFIGESDEVMRIKRNGRVGIGVQEPATALHLKSNAEILRLEGNDRSYISFFRNGGTNQSGYIGYEEANNTLSLNNEVGALNLLGNDISLNPGTGKLTIPSATEITENGETLKLIGGSDTQLSFYPNGISGGQKGNIGVAANGQMLLNSANSDIVLNPGGAGKRVTATGMVFVNSYELIHIGESNHIHERYVSDSYATRRNATNYNLSIYATHGIRAHEFVIASDERIKKDFSLSDGQEDLLTLSKIQVTDYHHIDEPANGKESRKGVIAQQVRTVFPEAINQGTDFIPNVFDFPAKLSLKNG